MIVTFEIDIPTPCNNVTVKQAVDLPIPSFDFSFVLNFPPKFYIPWPDCSIVQRLGSAPEPAEDSHK